MKIDNSDDEALSLVEDTNEVLSPAIEIVATVSDEYLTQPQDVTLAQKHSNVDLREDHAKESPRSPNTSTFVKSKPSQQKIPHLTLTQMVPPKQAKKQMVKFKQQAKKHPRLTTQGIPKQSPKRRNTTIPNQTTQTHSPPKSPVHDLATQDSSNLNLEDSKREAKRRKLMSKKYLQIFFPSSNSKPKIDYWSWLKKKKHKT